MAGKENDMPEARPDPHTTDSPGGPRGIWKARRSADSFFRCALTAKAICTSPLANLELPTVEQLAEAIAATISQRINLPPELQHAHWLTDTMTADGVEMQPHHTEPTLMRVGDDNLCAISLGKEDEEFADTLRLAVALTSPVALLRAADDEEELELNYEDSDSTMEVDVAQRAAAGTPCLAVI
eukprot:jgi/Tetstr1/449757/TSEL_036823.t1